MMKVFTPNPTTEEITLVKALAFGIYKRLKTTSRREESIVAPDAYFIYHSHQSCFEAGCDVLWKLDLTKASLNGKSSFLIEDALRQEDGSFINFPPYFELFSEDIFKQKLEERQLTIRPYINYIIETYLRLATDYGEPDFHLPTPRGEFFSVTHPDQIAPMDAFVATGHAIKDGHLYKWTDKVVFSMIQRYLWDETDFDVTSCDQEKVFEHTTSLLKVSENNPKTTYLWNLSVIFRTVEIIRYWDGKNWLENAVETPHLKLEEALAVSLELDKEP